jgi:hypothetical protein
MDPETSVGLAAPSIAGPLPPRSDLRVLPARGRAFPPGRVVRRAAEQARLRSGSETSCELEPPKETVRYRAEPHPRSPPLSQRAGEHSNNARSGLLPPLRRRSRRAFR